MAHKALMAHTSPAPKASKTTLSALSALNAHTFYVRNRTRLPARGAANSPRLQVSLPPPAVDPPN
jgi:hypothetical protein